MIRFTLFSLLILLSFKLWSQSDTNLNDYLIGDWYFMDAPVEDCPYDYSYNEIVFYDTIYRFINSSSLSMPEVIYKLDGNRIILYPSFDSTLKSEGELIILDSNSVRWNLKTSSVVLHRIIGDDYKLSEQIYDNIIVNKLRLKMPQKLSGTLWKTGYYYFLACMKRRETWARLEHKEIDKEDAIKWANERIGDCMNDFEVEEYEVFISNVEMYF